MFENYKQVTASLKMSMSSSTKWKKKGLFPNRVVVRNEGDNREVDAT